MSFSPSVFLEWILFAIVFYFVTSAFMISQYKYVFRRKISSASAISDIFQEITFRIYYEMLPIISLPDLQMFGSVYSYQSCLKLWNTGLLICQWSKHVVWVHDLCISVPMTRSGFKINSSSSQFRFRIFLLCDFGLRFMFENTKTYTVYVIDK